MVQRKSTAFPPVNIGICAILMGCGFIGLYYLCSHLLNCNEGTCIRGGCRIFERGWGPTCYLSTQKGVRGSSFGPNVKMPKSWLKRGSRPQDIQKSVNANVVDIAYNYNIIIRYLRSLNQNISWIQYLFFSLSLSLYLNSLKLITHRSNNFTFI